MAVKRSIALYVENNELRRLNGKTDTQLLQEIAFRTKEKQLIDLLKSEVLVGISEVGVIGMLFNKADSFGLIVQGLEESTKKKEEALEYTLRLKGNYLNCVKFLREVESTSTGLEIKSVLVYSKVERRSGEESLLMDVIFTKVDYGL
ncbi:MAG: hypothetical protein ABJN36_05970 [Cyclobacteriaceae bacterium]